jgi:hypothetical protein
MPVNRGTTPDVSTPVTPVTTTESDRVDGPQISVTTLYTSADNVFSEIPIPVMEKLTDLAKNRFSAEIVAAGQTSDKQLSVFRTTFICDIIAQQHKQLVSRVSLKKLLKAREFFKQLRARGVSRVDAIKLSGYDPDLE